MIYLACAHESASSLNNQISPALVSGRPYWEEIKTSVSALNAIGLFDKYPADNYIKEILIFEKAVLENKFQITSHSIPDEQTQSGIAKSERIKQNLEQVGI